MADRLTLHSKFEELLESDHVYYMPPENTKMEYDAIRYSKKNIASRFADNTAYSMMDCYEVIVIARKPDHPVIKKLLALPYARHDRHYVTNNLNHDILTIYY